MTTTLGLLVYSNFRRAELGFFLVFFSWIDEKQFKGLRAANVAALTEMLLVQTVNVTNEDQNSHSSTFKSSHLICLQPVGSIQRWTGVFLK